PLPAQVYVTVLIVIGVGDALGSIPRGAFAHPLPLAGFVLAALLASRIKINLPVRWSSSTVSIASAISFSTLLTLGTTPSIWVAMIGGGAQCTLNAKTRNPWDRTLFRISCLSLSA